MTKPEQIEFANANQFSEYVEKLHIENDVPYMDIILEYCADNYIDFEDIKSLVHPTLKDKLKSEAIERGLMKEVGNLPF